MGDDLADLIGPAEFVTRTDAIPQNSRIPQLWSRVPVHERIDSYLDDVDPDRQSRWTGSPLLSIDGVPLYPPENFKLTVSGRDRLVDELTTTADHEQIEQLPECCLMCGDDELKVQVTWVGDEIDSTRISCNECGWSTNGKPGARHSMRETGKRLGEEVSPFSQDDAKLRGLGGKR